MGFKEKQEEIDKWASQFNPKYWKPLEINARLSEEVGEVSRGLNILYGAKKGQKEFSKKELEHEIIDVFVTLICLANSEEIDLDKAWKESMEKHNKRDFHWLKKSE